MKLTRERKGLGLPNLDFFNLKQRIAKKFDWTPNQIDRAVEEYRRFLALCKENPQLKVCPSESVDEVWHLHILDTARYQSDCAQYFGYFLHHEPCLNGNAEVDKENTIRLYSEAFGQPSEVPGRTCANPGGGCGSISALPHIGSMEGARA